MLSDNSDGQIQGKQNYEVLVARYLNERAVLVDREACCSGMVWFPGYYAGQIICTLIAAVITWRDPPDWLDGILLGVIKFGVMIAGIVFFVWGIGYKLAFWGQHDPNTIYASANDVILPNLALGTGVLIAGWVYISYLKR